jgi:hypothetical protein
VKLLDEIIPGLYIHVIGYSIKMPQKILTIAIRILISIAIFIIVMFAAAWLLEDIIYFSLFIGIPAGIISAAVAFVILTG